MMGLTSAALAAALAVGTAVIPTIPTLHPPVPRTNGIVAAGDGTVYFIDSFHRTVWRIPPGGAPVPFVTGRNGRSLQIDADGCIYGMHHDDNGTLSVWRAVDDGTVEELVRPAAPRQYGHGFVVDDDGIIGFSGTGKRSGVRLWRAHEHGHDLVAGGDWGLRDGVATAARFFPIGAMTRAADGALLVTSGPTIRRVERNGTVRTIKADEPLLERRHTLLSRLLGDVQGHLTGIAQGAAGEIYVANSARGIVVRIDADGTAAVVAKSAGGWSPTGVTYSGGVLYVLDYGPGVRVRHIAGDGAVRVLAQVRPQQPAVAAALSGRWFMHRS